VKPEFKQQDHQKKKKKKDQGQSVPLILACNSNYSEAEIRRILVQSEPGQIVPKTLSQKKKKITKKSCGMAQGVG
jgi:hypothetical protein